MITLKDILCICDTSLPVVPEEDEISLVVKGDHPAAVELRVMWEQ